MVQAHALKLANLAVKQKTYIRYYLYAANTKYRLFHLLLFTISI